MISDFTQTLDVLRATRAKLAQGWCQKMSAHDPGGAPCMYFDAEATGWCLAGALAACTTDNDTPLGLWGAQLLPALEALGFESVCEVIDWNDEPTRTRTDIAARLDYAIIMLERHRTPIVGELVA